MGELSKIERLLDRCKCGVSIEVNRHRNYYETAAHYMAEQESLKQECPPEIEPEVRAEMLKRDTIIECNFYPDTPVGSYEVWHYDIDLCLDQCLEILAEGEPQGNRRETNTGKRQ